MIASSIIPDDVPATVQFTVSPNGAFQIPMNTPVVPKKKDSPTSDDAFMAMRSPPYRVSMTPLSKSFFSPEDMYSLQQQKTSMAPPTLGFAQTTRRLSSSPSAGQQYLLSHTTPRTPLILDMMDPHHSLGLNIGLSFGQSPDDSNLWRQLWQPGSSVKKPVATVQSASGAPGSASAPFSASSLCVPPSSASSMSVPQASFSSLSNKTSASTIYSATSSVGSNAHHDSLIGKHPISPIPIDPVLSSAVQELHANALKSGVRVPTPSRPNSALDSSTLSGHGSDGELEKPRNRKRGFNFSDAEVAQELGAPAAKRIAIGADDN
jgi:hypothetical protein